MGTGTLAVVLFAVMIMMAATVAVLTIIYASRLPSSRSTTRSKETKRGPVPPASTDITSYREMKPAEIEKGQDAGPGGQFAQAVEPSLTEPVSTSHINADESTRRRTQPHMSFLFNRSKSEKLGKSVPKEIPSVNKQKPAVQEEVKPEASITSQMVEQPEIPRDAVSVDPPVVIELEKPPGEAANQGDRLIQPAKDTQPTAESGEPTATMIEQSAGNEGSTPPLSSNAPGTRPQPGKSDFGDMSDLFAKTTTEESKSAKLAQDMEEVDVNDLLQQGLGLIGKLKKSE